jgi:Glyoxalase-like domain
MLVLDHIVFNARDRMDEVVDLFCRLGFTVAPRGHHTLGSINHVITFGGDYLELLGYPPGKPPAKRPELASHPIGLMATVIATTDADATRSELIGRGLQPRPVQMFSRPVDLGGGVVQDAAFRVTRLEPDAVPGTWFYYCQHLTPELVWRPEWQAHPNGASAIDSIDIVVPDLTSALPHYSRSLLGQSHETVGGSASPAIFRLRDCILRLHQGPGLARMSGLGFRVASLDALVQRLEHAKIAYDNVNQTILMDPAVSFGATLQFSALAR